MKRVHIKKNFLLRNYYERGGDEEGFLRGRERMRWNGIIINLFLFVKNGGEKGRTMVNYVWIEKKE